MSHHGTLPSTICDNVLAALRTALLFQDGGAGGGGTGTVKTIARIEAGAEDMVNRALTPGLPAILIYWSGASGKTDGTGGRTFSDEIQFMVFCASGFARSREERLQGESDYPGIEELLYAARYLTLRAIASTAGVSAMRPGEVVPAQEIRGGMYLGSFEVTCRQRYDIWDDEELGNALETLGIVHEPTDPDDLFEGDNITPKSDMPATTAGGVTDL